MKILNSLLETFSVNRKLTYDLLDVLSESDLEKEWKRPGLNSFKKHFLEMAAVQIAFTKAIPSKNMDFSEVPSVFDFTNDVSRQDIKSKLLSADLFLKETIGNANEDGMVYWFDMNLPVSIHMTNLIAHEVFHQGMMAMVLYQFELDIPSSWRESWGMPNTGDTNNDVKNH